jgi:hypothetical protein
VAETHELEHLAARKILFACFQVYVQVTGIIVVVHVAVDVDVHAAHGIDESLGAFWLDGDRCVDRSANKCRNELRAERRATEADCRLIF